MGKRQKSKQEKSLYQLKIKEQVKKEREKQEEQYQKYAFERQQIEQVQIENERDKLKSFPFFSTGTIGIEIKESVVKSCPVHRKAFLDLSFVLDEKLRNATLLIHGEYCIKCNTLYIDEIVRHKLFKYIKKNEDWLENPLIRPFCRKWKNPPLIKVEIMKKDNKRENQSSFNRLLERELKNVVLNHSRRLISEIQRYDGEIASVSACINNSEKLIHIIKNKSEEQEIGLKPGELMIHESEDAGRELLGRIAHDQLGEFSSKYGTIKIHNYKVWPGQEHHLDGFTRFCDPENIQNITIMSQNNLSRDSDEYEMVTALVYCANRVEPVYIDVYYSKRQNKYFINEESYRQYRVRYGLPYVHLVADEYDGDMDYGNLRKNSELNLYGYTVAKTAEMSTGERQRLLQQLMDNGLMSKHQIVNHLEWLIHRQSGRIKMEDACDCWREDLRFVNNYRLNAQRKIQGRFVYGKTVLR